MEINKKRKVYLYLLIVSVAFFIFKGVRYYLIDSNMPLFFSIMVVSLMVFSLKSKQYGSLALGIWSIFLFLWSLVRLIIPLLLYFSPQVTETHIRDQFTPLELMLSIFFLALACYLWRGRRVQGGNLWKAVVNHD